MTDDTTRKRAFRAAAGGRFALALPREVWLDHRHSVLPREVVRPGAVRRPPGEGQPAEVWFDFLQVVRRGVDPRGKRRVLVVSGGTMSSSGGPARRRCWPGDAKRPGAAHLSRRQIRGARRRMPRYAPHAPRPA